MPKIRVDGKVHNHKVVSERAVAHRASRAVGAGEGVHGPAGTHLSRQRRDLPWVKVEKPYAFDGPNGRETLAQLFGSRSQLVIYHFMFNPAEGTEGCKHCSFWADHYDGMGRAPPTPRRLLRRRVPRPAGQAAGVPATHGMAVHVGLVGAKRFQLRLSRVVQPGGRFAGA